MVPLIKHKNYKINEDKIVQWVPKLHIDLDESEVTTQATFEQCSAFVICMHLAICLNDVVEGSSDGKSMWNFRGMRSYCRYMI